MGQDQAIKLVQLRGALAEQGAEGDDGSATDVEADQAALSKLLELYDVHPNNNEEADDE